MKIRTTLILLIFASCHSPGSKNSAQASKDSTATPAKELSFHDTSMASSTTQEDNPNDKPIIRKTHLRDTLNIAGNFILFLRPDTRRFNELNVDPDEGSMEADADFGAGIGNTEDSVSKNKKYTSIKVLVSEKRYISIKDCAHCPLVIDRDSIDYGYILSGKGKNIDSTYNSVHSGDYLGEINDYFFTKH